GLKGSTAEDIDGLTVAPSAREVDAKARQLSRLKAHAVLSESLAGGEPFGASIVEAGRGLLADGLQAEAVSIGLNRRSEPVHGAVARVLLGVAYQPSPGPDVAWSAFARVNARDLIVAIAKECYPIALDSLGRAALPLVERSNETGETDRWSDKAVLR